MFGSAASLMGLDGAAVSLARVLSISLSKADMAQYYGPISTPKCFTFQQEILQSQLSHGILKQNSKGAHATGT